MAVKPIPEGYHTITPYIMAKDANKFIDFLKNAFDAKEIFRHGEPGGPVMHAELMLGNSMLMVSEASDKYPATSGNYYLYVEDCDAVYEKAIKAGATSIRKPENQFYGDRSSGVKDGFGNEWWIGTHVEDVPPEEMQKREEEMRKKKKS